jgi:hypothetical protein
MEDFTQVKGFVSPQIQASAPIVPEASGSTIGTSGRLVDEILNRSPNTANANYIISCHIFIIATSG